MGCSITIVKPEHRILDYCLEIGRLSNLPDDQNTTVDSSTGSSSRDIDYNLTISFNAIEDIADRCDILPQYCLRELRHAVETLHFKKPEISQRLSKKSEQAIASVRQKTLGLSIPYSCMYSPNESTLKLDFLKLDDMKSRICSETAHNSRASLIPPASPQTNPITLTEPHLQNPSKTPSISPATSPRTSETSPKFDSKSTDKRRASCPPPVSSSTERCERHRLELPNTVRPRLKSLDGAEEDVLADYGFYHPEEERVFEV